MKRQSFAEGPPPQPASSGGHKVLAGDLEAVRRTLCPQVLHVGRSIPVLSQLRCFLTATFPAEYEARAKEERPAAGTAAEPPIPLFVMAVMLPGAQTGRPSQNPARMPPYALQTTENLFANVA